MTANNTKRPPNRIVDCYADCTIFITGGTGFIGKLLVEKLLRVTNPKRIYLLVRPKKGKLAQERIKEFFDNMLFDVLKREKPNAAQKIQLIIGDICKENMGISIHDQQIIQNEVEFFFHAAASIRFDLSVYTAVQMNTRSTKYALELAKGSKNLKCFIYVSTAYSFPEENIIFEKMYKPPADPNSILNALDFFNFENNEQFDKRIIGNCPNTYIFSKALAEVLVYEQFQQIPSIIVRPSIIVPTLQDPFPGWCQSLQGPLGLLVGAGKGVVRSMYANKKSRCNMIPADHVVNGLMTAPWYFMTIPKPSRIINLATQEKFTFTTEEIVAAGKYVVYNIVPFNNILWYPEGSLKNTRLVHNFCFLFFQLIPAIFIDGLLFCLGYKPFLYNLQRRIEKGCNALEFFATKTWTFKIDSKIAITAALNQTEREMFELDPDEFDLLDYTTKCLLMIRRNNLNETDDMIPAAWRQIKMMYFLDKFVKTIFVVLSVYCFYYVIQTLFNYF